MGHEFPLHVSFAILFVLKFEIQQKRSKDISFCLTYFETKPEGKKKRGEG
jgi:hypothetical protein